LNLTVVNGAIDSIGVMLKDADTAIDTATILKHIIIPLEAKIKNYKALAEQDLRDDADGKDTVWTLDDKSCVSHIAEDKNTVPTHEVIDQVAGVVGDPQNFIITLKGLLSKNSITPAAYIKWFGAAGLPADMCLMKTEKKKPTIKIIKE